MQKEAPQKREPKAVVGQIVTLCSITSNMAPVKAWNELLFGRTFEPCQANGLGTKLVFLYYHFFQGELG